MVLEGLEMEEEFPGAFNDAEHQEMDQFFCEEATSQEVTSVQRERIADNKRRALERRRKRNAVSDEQREIIMAKRMKTLQARRDLHGFGALNGRQVAELREDEAAQGSLGTAEAELDTSSEMVVPCCPCQACGASVEEIFRFCTMGGVTMTEPPSGPRGDGDPMMDTPGQLESWLELIIEEEAAETMEQELGKECRFGSDEWDVQERARRLRTSAPDRSSPAMHIRTAAEQRNDDEFHRWEMGEEAGEADPQGHPDGTDSPTEGGQPKEGTDTDGEEAEQVEPVCKRGVGSADPMPCSCLVCLNGAVSGDDEMAVQEVASPVQQDVVCSKCGHSIDDGLCCQARPTGRAGERQRQEQAKRRRLQQQLQEEASLRPRAIPAMQDAITPAQRILARLRDKVRS